MIPIPRTSTPRPRSNKYNYKTTHGSSRSFTPLAIQSSLKKDSRVKVKKQQNENTHPSESLPFDNFQIRVPMAESKGFNAGKPIDLSQYHKKQSFILKKKNDFLQAKVNEQQKETQLLKNELSHLKSSLKENSNRHLMEAGQLKSFNEELQQKFQTQAYQIDCLKKQMKDLKHEYSFHPNETKVLYDYDKTQDKHQISRRVQYVQHYEKVVGKLQQDQNNCGNCQQKSRQLEEAKFKYSNQLRSLQEYVKLLKEKELMSEVLQKQVKSKNECIDYLRNQLQIVQINSNHLLEVIRSLQQRVEEVAANKLLSWERTNDSFPSFGGYKY